MKTETAFPKRRDSTLIVEYSYPLRDSTNKEQSLNRKQTMKTVKAINSAAQTEDIKTTTIGSLDALPKPEPGVPGSAWLRSGLLLAIVLLSTWLAITALNSIGDLNTAFDGIHAVATLPVR